MFTTSIISFDIGILALLFDLQQPISQVGKKGKDIYQNVHYPHCQIRMCLGAFEIRIKSIIFFIKFIFKVCVKSGKKEPDLQPWFCVNCVQAV